MALLKRLLFASIILATTFGDSSFAYAAATVSSQQGQNIFRFSEQFDTGSYWGVNGVSITPNVATNPIDSRATADALVDTGVNTVHFVSAPGTATEISGKTYTFSIYVKAGTRNWVLVAADNANIYQSFNVATGVKGAVNSLSGGGAILTSSKITPAGAGWFRCSLTFISNGSPSSRVYSQNADGGFVYAGNSDQTLYLFGAQEVMGSSPGAYNPTVATALHTTFVPKGVTLSNQIGQNRLTYSEQFDNVAWTKQASVTTTANQAVAPDGTQTADLVDVTSAAAGSGVFQVVTNGGVGRQNTKSVWLRGVLGGEVVNLADPSQTVGQKTCTLTTSWQRCVLTEPAGAQVGNAGLWIRKSSGNQFYAWGAQQEIGPIGAYNPTQATPKGTTVFPTGASKSSQLGQNLLVRSEQIDNASWSTTSGVTVTADRVTAPDGTMTADKVSFDIGASFHLQIASAIVPSGTYTFSVWLYSPSKATIAIVVRGTSSNAPLVGRTVTLTPGWGRYSFTGTLASNDAATYAGLENRAFAGGDEVTGFLYAWGAQLVQGRSPAAYNKTTATTLNPNYHP